MSEIEPEEVSGVPCRSCGILLPVGARFCGNCGVADPVAAATVEAPPVAEIGDDALTVPRGRAASKPTSASRLVAGTPPVRLTARPGAAPKKTPIPTQRVRPATPAPLATASSEHPDIEDELEEIGFLVAQGLDDDAREALAGLRQAHPNHPELARVREHEDRIEVLPRSEIAPAEPSNDARMAEAPPAAAVVEPSPSTEVDEIEVVARSAAPQESAVPSDEADEDIDAALDAIMTDEGEPSVTAEGTVIAPHPSAPAPFEGELASGGDALMSELGLARPRPRPRITVIPEDPTRPSPPAPIHEDPSGEGDLPPKGQTLVPKQPAEHQPEASSEPRAAEQPEAPPSETAEPSELTEGGTVIAVNPLPPAPWQGDGAPPSIRLVMLGDRGGPVDERVLALGDTLAIGRDDDAPWSEDPKLEPRHASLQLTRDGLVVEASDPVNGVFAQIEARTPVRDGDAFRVGESLLVYEGTPDEPDAGALGRLIVTSPAGERRTFAVGEGGLLVGREDTDVNMEDDTYVSGRHCRIASEGSDLFIEDLRSSNGTHIRLRPGAIVAVGARLLMGHTQFEVER